QDFLKNLKTEGPDENKIFEDNEDIISTVKKVTTSVSVEKAFSAAKELITSQRCNLNPTTIR
ncbi:14310_t:CDS:2, partial [Racocetra persica]